MKLKSLKLNNFRNYKESKIDFFEGINVFYGENAQGKTNILEAVYIFSSSKSHRGVKDKELILFGEEKGEIEINFEAQEREQNAKIELFSKYNKKLYINDIEQRKKKALLGVFSTVIFSPEDLFLIKEGPENRRKFMDTDISQLRPKYYSLIKEYKKIIDLKNNLLKKENPDIALIEVYNEKLAQLSAKITVHRHQFIEKLSSLAVLAGKYISDNKEEIEIIYKPNLEEKYELDINDIYLKYKKIYKKNIENEIFKRSCLYGPHRDDVKFIINGKDAKIYASQGQQRSAVLSLKLAEYEFMKEVLGEPPILLLDDILSELDLKRQEKLLKFIRENQTIITCTDKDLYEGFKYPYKIFNVIKGEIF